MKTVYLDYYCANPGDIDWTPYRENIELELHERTPDELVLERSADAQAILTNKVKFDRERLQQLPKLKYIGVTATGTDIIDLEAARELGICVTNVPAYSGPFVAQHVFALLLDICNRVSLHSNSVLSGDWVKSPDFSYALSPLIELKGKTFAIIGLGDIGRQAAAIAKAFGMRVIAAQSSSGKDEDEDIERLPLKEVFAQADVLSLHCPMTADTAGIINKENLCLMKKKAILINTARGGLVNDADLATALNEGKIAAAAADVLSQEPPPADNPLLSAPNFVLTPHIAWASGECRQRLLKTVFSNLQSFIAGSEVNRVN